MPQCADGRPSPHDLPRFTFVVNPALSEMVVEGVERFYERHGRLFQLSLFSVTDVEEGAIGAARFTQDLRSADTVFLDLRGGGLATSLASAALAEGTQPVLVLVGGSLELMQLLRLRNFSFSNLARRRGPSSGARTGAHQTGAHQTGAINVQRAKQLVRLVEMGTSMIPVGRLRDARNWARAMRYWAHGGTENVCNLVAFVGREYLGFRIPRPAMPRAYPDFGIYDPQTDRFAHQLSRYQRSISWDDERPTIGLLFYGGMHFAQSVVPARAICEKLRDENRVNVLPVFASPETNLKALSKYFCPGGKPLVDAVVYLQWFQLTMFTGELPDAALKTLKALNVPIINGAPMYSREVTKWRESTEGLSPIETLTTVIFPELDGAIEPIPVCGLEAIPTTVTDSPVRRVVPIPSSIDRVAQRGERWARLRQLDNAQKRVALILYNYPPGEDNLAGAAYLDVFERVRRLLMILRERGYDVDGIPPPGSFPERLLENGIVNMPKWSGEGNGTSVAERQYRSWLARYPDRLELEDAWGPPPGKLMASGDQIHLPVMQLGNVLVGLQPVRGYHEDPDKITHDKSLLPHHQYVAFYRWLEEAWQADVLVHIGTHGTLEFLPGKEVGSSDTCWPGRLLGDTPHLYLYHVVNASEAIIAKRRSLGTLVNYNSPCFTSSELYDDYARLEDLIAETLEATALDRSRAERLRQSVLSRAAEVNLPGETLEEIQEEVGLMKRSIIPEGLHVLGSSIDEQGQVDFATFLLRYDREESPSLHRRIAETHQWDYETLLRQPMQLDDRGGSFDALQQIEQEVRGCLERALFGGELPTDAVKRQAVEFARKTVTHLDSSLEIENLLNGLQGGFVEPGLGGDPLRNPEVLPTGRNSYQFDPRLIPSDEAIRRGGQIADNTLHQYRALHGQWPNSVGVILWGFETTKTRGETVGQVLHYFGVRIAPGANPWYKQLEAIPLAQLGRPRVDCHIQICGFFRDMYPNVVSLLNRAAGLAASLDEPEQENHVRSNTRAAADALQDMVPEGELASIASARVFGPRPGEYGTRATTLIESASWGDEQQIVDCFTASMNHLYADNLHGIRQAALFQRRLAEVELVSQVRDSHEYEIADLDHYYEFFGGLARTVESIRGSAPEMLITDTTKELLRTESVRESLNRGIRTRLLNPKWIDGMLRHDYHGTQEIAERVQYLIGFAATTHAVDNWVFSAVTERFIADREMFERLAENNRYATEEIMKRLFESEQRGYWEPTPEELDLLRQRYLELETMIEERLST